MSSLLDLINGTRRSVATVAGVAVAKEKKVKHEYTDNIVNIELPLDFDESAAATVATPATHGPIAIKSLSPEPTSRPVGKSVEKSPSLAWTPEFEACMRRLEDSGVNVAIFETGEMRIVTSRSETLGAIDSGAVIYEPREMKLYVTLTERERRQLHGFKKAFGATVDIKEEVRLESRLESKSISIAIDRETRKAFLIFSDLEAVAVGDTADVFKPSRIKLTPPQRRDLLFDLEYYEEIGAKQPKIEPAHRIGGYGY